MAESQASLSPISSQVYLLALKQQWADGTLSEEEKDFLTMLRKALGISEEQHEDLEKEAHLEIYLQVILDTWKDGILQVHESEKLEKLREEFHISAEDHVMIEKQVRGLLLKQK